MKQLILILSLSASISLMAKNCDNALVIPKAEYNILKYSNSAIEEGKFVLEINCEGIKVYNLEDNQLKQDSRAGGFKFINEEGIAVLSSNNDRYQFEKVGEHYEVSHFNLATGKFETIEFSDKKIPNSEKKSFSLF